eukprot:COSAG03_NODE_5734_length_1185_cov_1.693370_2_plen_69_part_01
MLSDWRALVQIQLDDMLLFCVFAPLLSSSPGRAGEDMNVPSDAHAHLIIQTYGTLLDCGNECEQDTVIL